MNANTRKLWQVNKYLWMSLLLALGYLVVAWRQNLIRVPLWAAWGVLGLGIADGAARSWVAYQNGGKLPDRLSWLFTYQEIGLIALAVAITGGIESDLWLFFFVVLIFETLYATNAERRLINASVTIAYTLATLPGQFLVAPPLVSSGVYARTLIVHICFLILVSSLGRRISTMEMQRTNEMHLLREQVATGEERARIAREVHDGLGHAMVSSILRLELCSRLIGRAPDEAEAILKEEIPALRAAWNEGRDLAFHLRPWEIGAVKEGGLAELLRRHIGRFAERTGLVVEFEEEGDAWTLSPQAAFGLARIVQEALTNAARHAQATRIVVSLRYRPKGVVVCSICDNGIGFEPSENRIGFGLSAMRERVEALGGTLEVVSSPGSGAQISVTLSEQ